MSNKLSEADRLDATRVGALQALRAFKRQVYARGCTARPTCGTCGVQRDPKDFGPNGWCIFCQADMKFADAVLSSFRDRLPPEDV